MKEGDLVENDPCSQHTLSKSAHESILSTVEQHTAHDTNTVRIIVGTEVEEAADGLLRRTERRRIHVEHDRGHRTEALRRVIRDHVPQAAVWISGIDEQFIGVGHEAPAIRGVALEQHFDPCPAAAGRGERLRRAVERDIGLLLEPLGRTVRGAVINDGEVVDADPAVVVEELADPNHLIANAGDQHDRLGSQIGEPRRRRIEADDEVLRSGDVHWPQANRQRDHAAS
jgi:hypothetical protein